MPIQNLSCPEETCEHCGCVLRINGTCTSGCDEDPLAEDIDRDITLND